MHYNQTFPQLGHHVIHTHTQKVWEVFLSLFLSLSKRNSVLFVLPTNALWIQEAVQTSLCTVKLPSTFQFKQLSECTWHQVWQTVEWMYLTSSITNSWVNIPDIKHDDMLTPSGKLESKQNGHASLLPSIQDWSACAACSRPGGFNHNEGSQEFTLQLMSLVLSISLQ